MHFNIFIARNAEANSIQNDIERNFLLCEREHLFICIWNSFHIATLKDFKLSQNMIKRKQRDNKEKYNEIMERKRRGNKEKIKK